MPRAKKLSTLKYGKDRRATRVAMVERPKGDRIREVIVPVPLTQTATNIYHSPSCSTPLSQFSPKKQFIQTIQDNNSFMDDVQELFPSRRKSGKNQNSFLLESQQHQKAYLSTLLEREAPPQSFICQRCLKHPGIYRCQDCFLEPFLCLQCCLDTHQLLPFHTLQHWNGECFISTTLRHLGYSMFLGHGGHRCPMAEHMDVNEWIDEDDFGNGSTLTLVDITGIYQHSVHWCGCEHAASKDQQLLQAGLFPASYKNPKTAFTFRVLDHFHIDSMECKTSAHNFYSKLTRITNNVFPDHVPDRYRELMRVSRIWRDLKIRKWFGYGHNTQTNPTQGDLAIFCSACPQPGINIPDNCSKDSNQWLYRRSIVVDGNFKAENLNMRKSHEDVALHDGLSYMVRSKEYDQHIDEAVEPKKTSHCSKHKAVLQSNSSRPDLRATGHGASACARHGCFVPHSVVDFQRGERYMNMDYSICQALGYKTSGFSDCLVIYDVGCQWNSHFSERVQANRFLTLPQPLKIIPAVGKFHLNAHVPDCFVKYSLNFIKGAGQLDGEILETLWAGLNKTTGSTRAMSRAHRQEILDDYIRDSNWKKLVGMVKMLMVKHKTSAKGVEDARNNFQELSESLQEEYMKDWAKQESEAQKIGGNALKIYEVTSVKEPSLPDTKSRLLSSSQESSTIASIRWLCTGLAIQVLQDGFKASCSDADTLSAARQELEAKIDTFNSQAEAYLKLCLVDELTYLNVGHQSHQKDQDNIFNDDGELNDDDEGIIGPDSTCLCLPSSLGIAECERIEWGQLAKHEMELRRAEANEALEKIRLGLGYKALLFHKKRRDEKSQRSNTRTWKAVESSNLKIQKHVKHYHRARQAIIHLGGDVEHLKEICKEDLSVNKDVTEANRHSQRHDTLPWIWRMGQGVNQDSKDNWMQEFYRVNWLRSKNRYERWQEEVIWVKHEMKWTISWFEWQKGVWETRKKTEISHQSLGHRAYAARQVHMWGLLAEKAREMFKGIREVNEL